MLGDAGCLTVEILSKLALLLAYGAASARGPLVLGSSSGSAVIVQCNGTEIHSLASCQDDKANSYTKHTDAKMWVVSVGSVVSVVSTDADVGGTPKSVQGVDADAVDADARMSVVSTVQLSFHKFHPRKPHENLA